ncbi:MAG: hypothetical protein VB125_03205 [Burkholderia sp.]
MHVLTYIRNIGAVPLLANRVSAYILDFCRKDAQGHYQQASRAQGQVPRQELGVYRIRLFRHDFAIRRQVARALPDGLRWVT